MPLAFFLEGQYMPYLVSKRNDAYCVYLAGADNQPAGDSLGCHAEPADAHAQIAAIEARGHSKGIADLDRVHAKYHDLVNMSASELEAWAETEASRMASLDRSPIRRNVRLLRTPKDEWGAGDIEDANRTIQFISRMRGNEQGEPVITQGGRAYSKRDISLMNWAYDPGKANKEIDAPEGVRRPGLWQQARNTVRDRVRVWPSAYASGQVVQEYERMGGTYATDKSIDAWFDENWVDISRPRPGGGFAPCGRNTEGMSEDEYGRAFPKCLPAAEAARLSDDEIHRLVDRKRRAGNTAGSPTYVSSDPGPQHDSSFRVFKTTRGESRWLAISSSAYIDKDSEIVSRKAIRGAVQLGGQTGDRGPLLWWHMPGIVLGQCDMQAAYNEGMFLIEGGTFHNEQIAQAVARTAQKNGMSIGFRHPANQPDQDGVFDTIVIQERSILPRSAASNRFTALKTEGKEMDEEKIKELREQYGEIADMLITTAEQYKEQAQAEHVTYKDHEPTVPLAAVLQMLAPQRTKEEGDDMMVMLSRLETHLQDVARKLGEYDEKMGDYMKRMDDELAGTTRAAGHAEAKRQQEIAALQQQVKAASARLAELEGDQPAAYRTGYRASTDPGNLADPEAVKQMQPQHDDFTKVLAMFARTQ